METKQSKQAGHSYDPWVEYDACAEWCAKHGHKGNDGDPLPLNIGAPCLALINDDPEAFRQRIQECAYAQMMRKLGLPEDMDLTDNDFKAGEDF